MNHRFLDLQVRLPSGCDALEVELRRVLKGAVERGHVEVTLEVGDRRRLGCASMQAVLDELVLAPAAADQRLGLTQEPELAALLRVPGVMTMEAASGRVADGEMDDGGACGGRTRRSSGCRRCVSGKGQSWRGAAGGHGAAAAGSETSERRLRAGYGRRSLRGCARG